MLIVIVDFTVPPAQADLALATLQAEAQTVRALPGNLGFAACSDPDHPGTLRLMHEWTDSADFAAYRESDGFKASGAVLFPLMVGKPLSRVFEAREVAP